MADTDHADCAHDGPDAERGCCSRLGFLTASVAAAGTPVVFFPARAAAQAPMPAESPRSKVVLLGTAGGPGVRGARMQPATAVVVDGVPYIIDCGNGVARAMFSAGLPLAKLNTIFVTHHHSDHIADYGALMLIAWGNGLKTPVATFGPPPLAAMTNALWSAYARDIEVRVAEEGRPPLVPLVRVTELTADGEVYADERVRVTAAVVNHGKMKPAFAYRFDTADRAIVISGDTIYDENLIRLARGADLLVHEALYTPGLDRLLSLTNNASTLREHIVNTHTDTVDVGRVAAAAGVKALVLTHLVPAADPSITDDMWLAAVRKNYGGPAQVGRDLASY
jgi:ribonuclease BN (tRNA processing enzyme)